MMPAEDSSTDTSRDSKLLLFGLKDVAPFQSNAEQSSLLSIFGPISKSNESLEVLSLKSSGRSLEKNTELSDCDEVKNINIKLEKQISCENLRHVTPAQFIGPKKSMSELELCSSKELELLLEEMSHVIKKVSSELVQLLLENDALQQESDARNIAIEQLLKMTVKNTDCECKQIQMSVILPSDQDSDGS